METKTGKEVGDLPRKKRRLPIYMLIGSICVLVLALFIIPSSPEPQAIGWDEFKTMLQAHDIGKLVEVDKEYVEVFVKKEKLESEEKYRTISKSMGPHYKLNIMSPTIFDHDLNDLQRNFSDTDKITYTWEIHGIFSHLFNH